MAYLSLPTTTTEYIISQSENVRPEYVTFVSMDSSNLEITDTGQLPAGYTIKTLNGNLVLVKGDVRLMALGDESYVLCTELSDQGFVDNYFVENVIEETSCEPTNEIFINEKLTNNELITFGNGNPLKDLNQASSAEEKQDELFACKYCHEKFSKWLLLKRHENRHIDEKPHKCDKCASSFNVMSNLKLHMAIHQTEPYACPECKKVFLRLASLRAHLNMHEIDEHILCPECESPFDTQLQLDIHMKSHEKGANNSSRLTCKSCQKQFKKYSEYRVHMQEHTKLRQILTSLNRPAASTNNRKKKTKTMLKCDSCPKSFAKYSQLVRHTRVHSGERPFKCQICEQAFSQNNTLKIHMSKHTGSRPYKCILCTAAFSQRGNLRVHILRVHSVQKGESAFPCTECKCSFRKLSALNAHINRVHAEHEVRPTMGVEEVINELVALNALNFGSGGQTDILQQALQNSTIEGISSASEQVWDNTVDMTKDTVTVKHITLADTTTNGQLQRYVIKQRKVGNVRWHQCSFCTKEFKKPSDLVRHIRIHTREKPYKCNVCTRNFSVKSTLTSHIRTHCSYHKEHVCNICKKGFSMLHSLEHHQKRHANAQEAQVAKSEKCKLKQEQKNNLTTSLKSTLSNVELQEPILITDQGHLQTYMSNKKRVLTEAGTKLRPHICSNCGAGFRKFSHLKQHLRVHTDDRPFSCNICKRSFRSASILRSHMRCHDGLRSYSCTECRSMFTARGSLQRHMARHTNRRPYLCPYCQKSFKTASNCKKHIKTHKMEVALKMHQSLNIQESVEEPTYDVNSEQVLHTLLADETGTVTLAGLNTRDLPQEVMLQMENSLNKELCNLGEETTPTINDEYANLQLDPIASSDLISTLTGNQNENNLLVPQILDTNLSPPATLLYSLSTVSEEKNATGNSKNTNLLWTNAVAHGTDNVEFLSVETPLAQIESQTAEIADVQEEHVIAVSSHLQSGDNNTGIIANDYEEIFCKNSETVPTLQISENSHIAIRAEKNKCKFCLKTFRKLSDLLRHIRTHTGERPFECDICNKNFTLKSTLKNHKKIHNSTTKEFRCNVCSSNFSTKGSLKVHMRLHTGAKPFKCQYCQTPFRTSGHRQAHHQVHLKEAERTNTSPSAVNTNKQRKWRSLFNDMSILSLENVPCVATETENEKAVCFKEMPGTSLQDSQLQTIDLRDATFGNIYSTSGVLNVEGDMFEPLHSNLVISADDNQQQLAHQKISFFDDITVKGGESDNLNSATGLGGIVINISPVILDDKSYRQDQ